TPDMPERGESGDLDIVSMVSEFIANEFKAVEEKEWFEKDQEDLVLQQVKGYVRSGWPKKESILEEVAPFFKIREELEIENDLLFKKEKCIPPMGMQSVILSLAHVGHPGC
ncbi:hypothetical protein NDU88_003971, partial [Pleurodeles waltl]